MKNKKLLATCLVFVCCFVALADDIYVSVEDTARLVKFDSNGNGTKLPMPTGVLCTPNQLAFDSAGNLYFADLCASIIGRYDTHGTTSIFASNNIAQPSGVAFDKQGNLFVLNRYNNSIWKFDPQGNGTFFASSTNLVLPLNLTFDDNGNLYVANTGGGTIAKFDSLGTYSVFASLSYPAGLAFRNGILYASTLFGTEVFQLDRQGNSTGFVFSSPNLQWPSCLAFDSAGNLYVGNHNGASIGKFDPQGVYTQFSITNFGTAPSGVVCRAVAPPAVLTVQLLSSTLLISWPPAVPGAELQQASDITSSTWAPVTNTLNAANGQVLLTLPKFPGKTFYRLKHL
jgi:sugar lactone lactonase YvrE